jgi:hypothetical protein
VVRRHGELEHVLGVARCKRVDSLLPFFDCAEFRRVCQKYTKVYFYELRTSIVLNVDLLREAALYAKSKTKTGLIEEALLVFVRVKAEEKAQGTVAFSDPRHLHYLEFSHVLGS